MGSPCRASSRALAATRACSVRRTSGAAPTTRSAGASPSPTATASQVAEDPERALAAVARAEDELTLTGKRSAFAAESGAFARVLASMAAAAAQQAVLLRGPGAVAR